MSIISGFYNSMLFVGEFIGPLLAGILKDVSGKKFTNPETGELDSLAFSYFYGFFLEKKIRLFVKKIRFFRTL